MRIACTLVMPARWPAVTCCIFAAPIVLLVAAHTAGAKSIFDDDWTPPARTEPAAPAAPAPTNRPTPPLAGVPKVVGPDEKPVTPAIAPAAPAPRQRVPGVADQAKSRKLMEAAFSKELVDGSPSARRALARKLLDEAVKMPDAPADQFVVLGGAIQSAIEAADLPLALEAANQMADSFDLDGLSVKASAALKMPAKSYAANAANVPAGMALLEPLESAEDFAAASRLVTVLEQVPRADPLLRSLPARAREVEELRAARERLTPALEKLKTAPDDPAANLAVGRYTALLRGDWERGLPLLAKGDDAKLAALAKAALAGPADANARAKLADGWWDLAQAESGLAKTILAERAADDYQLALPGLTGLERVLAEKRMAEAEAAALAAGRSSGTVHLLPLIDDRDLANARWTRQGQAVVCAGGAEPSLTLPYLAPDEYDFAAEFSRLKGDDGVQLAFPVGRGTCDFVIGGSGNREAWLGRIGGKWRDGNPTLADASVPNNQRHRIEVKVRRDRVEGYLDGRPVCNWKTNGDDLAGPREHMPRSPGLMTIGTWESEVAFYSVDVTPLHGGGMVARERDAAGWIYNPAVLHPSADGDIVLPARDATVHGRKLIYVAGPGHDCFEIWESADDYVTWFVDAPKPGDYTAAISYSCSEGQDGSDVELCVGAVKDGASGGTPLALHVLDTGGWGQFRTESVGTLHRPAGRQTVLVKVKNKAHRAVMNLQKVVLAPAASGPAHQ